MPGAGTRPIFDFDAICNAICDAICADIGRHGPIPRRDVDDGIRARPCIPFCIMRSMLLVCLLSGACAAQPINQPTVSTPPTPATPPTVATPASTLPPSTMPSTMPSADPGTSPASPRTTAATGLDMSSDDLLDAMDRVGKGLRTLKATVQMSGRDETTGNGESRNGEIVLARASDGDTRARVRFNDHVVNKRRYIERSEFLLAGDQLVQRDYGRDGDTNAKKKETQRQVRKPGEKTDLLKLGEGPFPLPIGQPCEQVKDQFTVTRLPDDAKHPGLIVLELRPRESSRLSRKFESITVEVDPTDALPRVIETVEPEGAVVNTTVLTDVKLNADVTDADFTLETDRWQLGCGESAAGGMKSPLAEKKRPLAERSRGRRALHRFFRRHARENEKSLPAVGGHDDRNHKPGKHADPSAGRKTGRSPASP